MATRKNDAPGFQLLALNNGNLTHVGAYDNEEDARAAAQAWFEQRDRNISGWTFFLIQGEVLEL